MSDDEVTKKVTTLRMAAQGMRHDAEWLNRVADTLESGESHSQAVQAVQVARDYLADTP